MPAPRPVTRGDHVFLVDGSSFIFRAYFQSMNQDARYNYRSDRLPTGAVRLFVHAVSLGGVDSLIQHPAALTHRPVAAEARPGADIVRLSIGLENVEDLLADLEQALVITQAAVAVV